MKARMLLAAVLLSALPALANAQVGCSNCSHGRSPSVVRPASAELWAGYETHDCGGCGSCRRCCDPCCTPLLCVVPNTLRRVGRALDCLLPCGPRSGHGCGISCIGAGSGCMGGCGRPGIFSPSCCDMGCGEIAPPMYRGPAHGEPLPQAPQPMQETRRAPAHSSYAQAQARQITAGTVALRQPARPAASAVRPIGSGVSRADHVAPVVNKSRQPVSVLKRINYEEEIDSRPAKTPWPKAMDTIPHNPLR